MQPTTILGPNNSLFILATVRHGCRVLLSPHKNGISVKLFVVLTLGRWTVQELPGYHLQC